MEQPVVIKKYANRRLYNTATSKYITLNDLSDLIRDGKQIKVIEANTKEDVTAFILTQIVLEEAKSNNALLPTPILHLIIRYADNILLEFFDNYLNQIINNYISYKHSMEAQFQKWLDLGMGLSGTSGKSGLNFNPFEDFFKNMGTKTDPDEDGGK